MSTALVLTTVGYGFVGVIVGIFLNWAGCWLLQRRARAQDLPLLFLSASAQPPGSSTSLPRWMALVGGAGFAGLWVKYGVSVHTIIISGYFSVFLLIFALDITYRWVPNALLWPTAALVLTVSVLTRQPPLVRALLGGIVGFVWFYLIAIAYRGALGAGDVKLAALIGLMTGFPGVVTALTLGILFGGSSAALLLISGQKTRKSYIPYAPFLVTGALLTLVFGAQLTSLSSLSGW
ncbi:MAG: prepilin peptidase [Anaerolineae bacterium]